MPQALLNLPYRFYEFWVPTHGVYKQKDTLWTNILGTFIAPIVKDEPDLIYWFVQEGRHFQFCFAHSDPDQIAKKIRAIQRHVRIRTKRILKGDTGSALGGTRWVSTKRLLDKTLEKERSELMLKAMHGVCSIYLHSLEKRGAHWQTEISGDTKQNPHGNLFESFMHLIANTTQAKFNVRISARTGWMQDPESTSIVCHL